MKNILEFQNQFFQHAVNKVINSLESDNYNIDLSKYNQAEVKIGLEKEQEHTDDPKELYKIVADHLDEDPAYYSKLEKAGFDDSLSLFQKNIKSEIDEGAAPNRWKHTLSTKFAKYVLNYFKENPDNINSRRITFPKSLITRNFGKGILNRLKQISIFITKDEDVDDISIPEAGYYKSDDLYQTSIGNRVFKRGEISIDLKINPKINSFSELKHKYQYFYETIQELFRHELEHFFDDYDDEKGPIPQNVDKDNPYDFLTQEQKEDFNYLVRPHEVRAYVIQIMEAAKRKGYPLPKHFLEELENLLDHRPEFSDYKNPRMRNLLKVLKYEYLQYAVSKYSFLAKDSEVSNMLNDLDELLLNKGLHMYRDISEGKTKLSKYWHKRAKSRAKRAGRHFPNNKDKEWAIEQEEKSKDVGSTLKKAFEAEIKESEEISKRMDEIINSVKNKRKFKGKDPFLSGITGRAKGFKQKHRGSMKAAPFETIGPLGEGEK